MAFRLGLELIDMASVLFLNRVYPPAPGATGEMLRDLAVRLSGRGHEITVLTTSFEKAPCDGVFDGVRVVRIPAAFSKAGFLRRALSYLLMIPRFLTRALWLPRHDFVVTKTDPPMLVVLGPMLATFKGCRVVHWAQDLYPEVAEELGVLPKGNPVTRLLKTVSTFALRRCDAVVSIGRCMTRRLRDRGVAFSRIHEIPNWAPRLESPDRSGFRARHGLEGDFVVQYSGNLGLAHEFDTLLETAFRLREQPVVFLVVGSGPRLAELIEASRLRGLANIRFLPSQPSEGLADSLAAADAHWVSLRSALCGLVVPSKVYGALASGRPVVFAGPASSEAARLIKEHGAGVVVEPGRAADLAGAILDWLADPAAHQVVCRKAMLAGSTETADDAAKSFEEMLGQTARKPAARG